MLICTTLSLVFLFLGCLAEDKLTIKISSLNKASIDTLHDLEKHLDINFLVHDDVLRNGTIAVIDPENLPQLVGKLPNAKIEDISAEALSYLSDMNQQNENARIAEYSNYFTEEITNHYPDLNEIDNWLRTLASKYAGRVSLSEYGRTYENRPLNVLKINVGQNLPVIIVESAIHSREWLAPVACMRLANKVLQRTDNHWDKFEFHFIIVANPDGYAFTHQNKNSMNGRFWRKNRRPNPQNPRCIGADLNRNWDIDFGRVGVSFDCNTEIYPGSAAFSEPESRALANYVRTVASRTKLYLSVHTFGSMIITPYVYKMQKPVDNAYQFNKATQASNAIFRYSGDRYRIGNGLELGLGAVSGSTIDYMKDKLGIKNAFAFELRPNNKYVQGLAGFAPQPNQILPAGEEFSLGVRAMLNDL